MRDSALKLTLNLVVGIVDGVTPRRRRADAIVMITRESMRVCDNRPRAGPKWLEIAQETSHDLV